MNIKLKDLIVRTEVNKEKLTNYLEENPEQRKYEKEVLDNRVVVGMSYEMCLR